MKKHYLVKILLAVWEIFLHENNRNYNSYIFSNKFAFILFFSFLANQKQESGFQQVGCLVTRNISVFCLQQVAVYFKATPNSTDFYKGIFLYVIPVRITVPCYKSASSGNIAKASYLFNARLRITHFGLCTFSLVTKEESEENRPSRINTQLIY